MMTEAQYDLLVAKMDEFIANILPEIEFDKQFVVGDVTAVHLADAAKVVFDAMCYSAKLEAEEK